MALVAFKCPVCSSEEIGDVELDRRWITSGKETPIPIRCEQCLKRVLLVFKLIRVERG